MNRCLICNSPTQNLGKAVIMPFIYKRIWGNYDKLTYTKLRRCNHCGFLFYEERLNNKESEKYYDGYWQDEYHKQRSKTEWWFNSNYLKKDKEIQNLIWDNKKQNEFEKLIKSYTTEIKTILDFGGHDGNKIPSFIKRNNYFVYDIDNKKIKLKKKYDLVTINSVLEHLSYPMEIFNSFDFNYLYIEVPIVKPLILSLSIKRRFKQYIIDIWKIIRYRSLYSMHEHINYFSKDSLKEIAKKLNCKILYYNNEETLHKILMKNENN